MQGLCRPTSILELNKSSHPLRLMDFHSAIHCQGLNRCFINVHGMNQTAEEVREEQSNDDLSYHHKLLKQHSGTFYTCYSKEQSHWRDGWLGTDGLSFLSFYFFPPVPGYSKT